MKKTHTHKIVCDERQNKVTESKPKLCLRSSQAGKKHENRSNLKLQFFFSRDREKKAEKMEEKLLAKFRAKY